MHYKAKKNLLSKKIDIFFYIDIFSVSFGKFRRSNKSLIASDHVDLGSFYRIQTKLVIIELRLNLLSFFLSLFVRLLVIRTNSSITLTLSGPAFSVVRQAGGGGGAQRPGCQKSKLT